MSTINFILILFLAIITVALILAEIFFIPGFGLLGILGGLGFIGSVWYLISIGSYALAIIYGVLSIILFIIGFYFLSRNKFIKKIALTDSVNEVAIKLPKEIHEGANGVAVSRLALTGTIRIGEELLEGESEDGFIDEGESIVISDIRNNKVYVKRGSKANNE